VRWGLDCAAAFSPSPLPLSIGLSSSASCPGLGQEAGQVHCGIGEQPLHPRLSLSLISFVSLEFPAPMNFQSLIPELSISSIVCALVVPFEFRLLCWYSINLKNLSRYFRYQLAWVF
jgi:hypothetical protein